MIRIRSLSKRNPVLAQILGGLAPVPLELHTFSVASSAWPGEYDAPAAPASPARHGAAPGRPNARDEPRAIASRLHPIVRPILIHPPGTLSYFLTLTSAGGILIS